jgi:hypothetical protein
MKSVIMQCENCKADLDFIRVKDVDYEEAHKELYMLEEWECLECHTIHEVVRKGRATYEEIRYYKL